MIIDITRTATERQISEHALSNTLLKVDQQKPQQMYEQMEFTFTSFLSLNTSTNNSSTLFTTL